MEWRHSGSPRPKNSKCKNPLENFSPDFLGSRWHPPHFYLPKGQTINAKYYLSLLVQLKDILKEKRRGKVTKGSCSCTTMPRLTGYLQPRRNWAPWTSSVLITHPFLRIWPRRTTICSLDWKSNWKVAIFRPTRRSLLQRRPGWTDKLTNFLSGLQVSKSNGLRSALSFVGNVLNKSRVWSLVGLRTYQHPLVL